MLVGKNAFEPGVNQSWQQDNQAWWDWYVTLAENTDQHVDGALVQLPTMPHLNCTVQLNGRPLPSFSKGWVYQTAKRLVTWCCGSLALRTSAAS
jgi:hypothetical protein